MTPRETAGAVLRRWRGTIDLRVVADAFAASIGYEPGLAPDWSGYLAEWEHGSTIPTSFILHLARAHCVALGCPECTGELLCELWAALDDRPWYRVDEVPPPEECAIEMKFVGLRQGAIVAVFSEQNIDGIMVRLAAITAGGDLWRAIEPTDYWRPLGRGPATKETPNEHRNGT